MKKIVELTFLIVLVVVFIVLSSRVIPHLSEKYTFSENAGDAEHDFTVLDRNGAAVSFSDLAGKPTVIIFWATWCEPCKAELAKFEEFYGKYGGSVNFMMVDLTDGSKETISKARSFIEDSGYTCPVYFDVYSDAIAAYGSGSIPTTVFIDSKGDALVSHVGAIGRRTFELYIGYLVT